ncbi:hypothetical protein NPIL_189731 [Nephila pilipes]|uniref:Uncharacterized protein n=1 Tax=Nephila pilipes TaxID=299642 RepID=A0A8X6PQS3_NEPPI|nr:hypothetical protein NPIL_189731 [Nephila pilipes]
MFMHHHNDIDKVKDSLKTKTFSPVLFCSIHQREKSTRRPAKRIEDDESLTIGQKECKMGSKVKPIMFHLITNCKEILGVIHDKYPSIECKLSVYYVKIFTTWMVQNRSLIKHL